VSFDTEVLIGAGMSGLGLAVQLIRKFGVNSFEIIEKSNDVGGTWLVNTALDAVVMYQSSLSPYVLP
jgi:cation diffusion facilitator CzcD-associated flavoprotein CzcO